MKKFITIIVFIFSAIISSQAQNNWPKVGTEWYYSFLPCNDSYCPDIIQYIHLKVDQDTLINDTLCSQIKVEYHISKDSVRNLGYEYIFSTEDSVFAFHHNQFNLLYDFSAKEGDTILLQPGANSDVYKLYNTFNYTNKPQQYIVHERDSVELSGVKYKSINYELIPDWEPEEKIIHRKEKDIFKSIGSTTFLTGVIYSWLPEYNIYGPIRCFNSATLNFQQGTLSCDSITNVLEMDDYNPLLQVFPVPMKESLTVAVQVGIIMEISIFNNLGQPVFSSPFNSSSVNINVNQLKKGIYFLKVKTNNKILFKKIIK